MLDLIVDFHKDADRQGPGGETETKKALSFIQGFDEKSRIIDIGCGTGAQTMVLAENLPGNIIAVDYFDEFLDKLNEKISAKALEKRVKTKKFCMTDLPFKDGEFDLIWSEGAIYIMGFEEGLKDWKKFLKKDGYLVVSEISWLTEERPEDIENYWVGNYPQIDTISNKISLIEANGYEAIAHFVIPENCWLENYYNPIFERLESFFKKHNSTNLAQDFIAGEYAEIEMYKKYKDYYSYVFYIAQKK